jgi:arabinan endo-1,5-alpha-L-arabinosidase
MKRFDNTLLIVTAVVLSGCGAKFSPTDSPNPWADRYENVASIDSMAHWAAYNVHDPCIRKFGDTYYCYNTDAAWWPPRPPKKDSTDAQEGNANRPRPRMGNIPMRKSNDLVHWEFAGFAFDSIPA